MVAVVGTEHGDPSSNPVRICFISHSPNTFKKGMNPPILLPTMDK